MIAKLLTEHHLEFLSLKGAAQAGLSQHLSNFHIVGNHVSWLKSCMILSGQQNHATGLNMVFFMPTTN